MPKKRTVRKENRLKKLIEEEKADEIKAVEKKKRREDLRQERRDELIEKLEKVAETLEDGGAGAKDKSGDVDMRPAGSVITKKIGVIRKIGKDKTRARASKSLLKVAKQRGIIHDVALAKRLLEDKRPRNKTTPYGKELKRDKRLRTAREKRMRKCGIRQEEDGEDEDDE
eukprot:CAMPEP_0203920590 /NCGR_PEP_ID=MMETSP0359-20131031/60876_1 /ASSEMBLY_ACC=CAM_ASM_000338 /TAXON_ID=268821 /ORGANISM="Scrippsiella Hangoei, Strain SHTV-5" /LENGTH=169 /DNA_ID=CAMNT_0050848123 /DNA_START=62 /DNA_END=571 /DNA_ORIENTATION=+